MSGSTITAIAGGVVAVPEPGAVALLIAGFVAGFGLRRKLSY